MKETRDELVQNILNVGCAMNSVPKRCHFEGCFNPAVPGTDTCDECMVEIAPPDIDIEDAPTSLTEKIDELH